MGNPARPLVKREAAGIEAFDPGPQETPPDPYEVWGEWFDQTRRR